MRMETLAVHGTHVQCKMNVVNLPVSELDLGEKRWLSTFQSILIMTYFVTEQKL